MSQTAVFLDIQKLRCFSRGFLLVKTAVFYSSLEQYHGFAVYNTPLLRTEQYEEPLILQNSQLFKMNCCRTNSIKESAIRESISKCNTASRFFEM